MYSTDAIVLKIEGVGEADIAVWLLTRELGLVIARAQSARKESAKMRGYLQTFVQLKVSLVRGRYAWRITGTEHPAERAQGVAPDTDELKGESLSAFARIAVFLRRMTISDTQSSLELFDIVLAARRELAISVSGIELKTMAKILASLGYLDVAVLKKMENKEMEQNQLAVDVNKAIVESQL